MLMKKCGKCQSLKPITEYHKSKRDGASSRCKLCKQADRRLRYINNRTKLIQDSVRWARNNPDKKKIHNTRWRKNNSDKSRFICSQRRRRIRNAEGSHTLREWEDLKKAYGHKCARCREVRKLTEDHIVPISKGGSNYINNIQPLCLPCNDSKGVSEVKYGYL